MLLIVTLLVAFSNFFLGLLAFKKNPHSATHKLFLVLTSILALWTVFNYFSLTNPTAEGTLFWIRAVMAVTGAMFPTIFLLVKAYPSKTTGLSPKLLWLIAGLTIGTQFLSLTPLVFSRVTLSPAHDITPTPGPGMAVFALNVIVFSLLTLITLFKKYKKVKGIEKTQLKFLVFGIIATFLLSTITNFVFVTVLHISSFVAFGPVFNLILVGSIAYAIVRHKFLDIGLIVARTVTFSIVILVLVLIYIGFLFLVANVFFNLSFTPLQQVVLIALSLIVTFSYAGIEETIRRLTDKIFFKHRYNSSAVLSTLSKIMASSVRLHTIAGGMLRELLSKLKITRGAFVLFSSTGRMTMIHKGYVKKTLKQVDMKYLAQVEKTLVFDEMEEGPHKDMLRINRISVVADIRTKGKVVGLLVLGEKASGDTYSDQDLKVIEILTPQAAIAFQNALAYEEIKQFNVNLKKEIDRATSDLRKANKKLMELDKLKDEFISITSHELRTPMTAIKGYLWLLVKEKVEPLPPKTKEYLNRVYHSTERLINLVNDMLDVSRISSGKLKVEKTAFNMTTLLEEVAQEFLPRAMEKNINIAAEHNKLPLVEADRDKMRQVLMNLVSNAVKFTPERGAITLSGEQKKGHLMLSVADTGTGIAREDMPKLFKKFGRIDSSLAPLPGAGTGLGLYICKQLVELHDGTISVHSQLGKGTTFIISLPLKKSLPVSKNGSLAHQKLD